MADQDPSRPDPAELPPSSRPGHGRPQLDHLRHALGGDDELPIDPDLEPDDTRAPSAAHRPHTPPLRPARRARVLAAVFVGGALGTLARDVVERGWPQPAGHFPTATFVVNTTGAFLLGAVLTVLLERYPRRGRRWHPFLCTGVLGGWTTYSSLVVDADSLAKSGHTVVAAGYVATTLVCGTVAAALGIGLGRSRLPGLPSAPSAAARTDPRAGARGASGANRAR